MALQHLRTSTANKRPVPGNMSEGQLALNSNNGSPGLFFRDSNSNLVKVGPVHVGTTAPNASPAVGGTAGNSVGEQWLDTTGGTYVFKVWDGSAWRSESGTFVDVNGDVMTGALGIIAGSAAAPGLYLSGDTDTGIYSLGADQLALATGGTGRLFVDASGRVGIGASAPSTFFHANGTGLLDSLGNFSSSTDNTAKSLIVASTGATGGVGQLGASIAFSRINTTSPRAAIVAVQTNVNNERMGLSFWTHPTSTGTDPLVEAMRIIDNGYVGIGTTSPDLRLTVLEDNPGRCINLLSSDGNAGGRIGTTGEATTSNGLLLNANRGSGSIQFQANSLERARIDSSGRLLVGTSSTPPAVETIVPQLVSSSAGISTGAQDVAIYNYQNAGGSGRQRVGPKLLLGNSRSGTNGSLGGIVASGDQVGNIRFAGDDGSAFITAAEILAEVDGTPSANDMPGRLVFSTTSDATSSPTERLRVTSDGYVRLSASSPGIQFGGDTAAANALDDYEEGTFTPTVTGSSTAGTGTYNTNGQVGRYTKIGNRVSFTIYVDWSAHTGTGNLRVSGLPFTSNSAANAFNAVALYAGSLTYTGPMLQAYFGSASTTIIVGQMTAAGVTSGVPMDTAANLTLSGHYEV